MQAKLTTLEILEVEEGKKGKRILINKYQN
jgi:hypothetical protein